MPWKQATSSERIAKHLENLGEIEVEKLVREADLDTLLTETVCREIFGAHVYATIPNFTTLLSDKTLSKDGYARLIRCLHCYEREVSRIVEAVFDGVRVHFQGPKLHALIYRPIEDGGAIATRAALLQLVLRDFMSNVFNEAFPLYTDFAWASASDIGEAIGTKNGQYGRRELLFVGPPANYAAKLVATGSRLSSNVHASLPQQMKDLCTASGDAYRIAASKSKLDELLAEHGVVWDRAKSQGRLEEDRDSITLDEIDYSDANVKIKFEDLSIRNNKRVTAASVFADVCGFTAFVDQAQSNKERIEALRVFAGMRREFAKVIKEDYDGVRVQYQGDRIQGIVHLPKGDNAAISRKAVEIAIALQSSMEITLKEHLPAAKGLAIAVGVDIGTTLASNLGSRGQRDRICVGLAVERAAELEGAHGKRDIAISASVYNELLDDVKGLFKKSAGEYAANGVSMSDLELAQKAKVYDSGTAVAVGAVLGAVGLLGVATAVSKSTQERPSEAFTPSRTHGELQTPTI